MVPRDMSAYQGRVSNELSCKPQERFLKVVVGLGGNVVVLEVLLAVEGDSLGLDLTLLHINLVTAEDNGDVLADTDEITWIKLCEHQVTEGWPWISWSDYLRCQLGTFL